MFYGDNVQDTRQIFYASWLKYLQKQPLDRLEKQIVAVIIDHPEYQTMLEPAAREDALLSFPGSSQTNPFLHMGLHLAIRDQTAVDRPAGIRQIHKQLLHKYGDQLAAEHAMMDSLAECLWQAQRSEAVPDEAGYLAALTRLL